MGTSTQNVAVVILEALLRKTWNLETIEEKSGIQKITRAMISLI